MRFECGIENRFECSLCHKRFPYKQNAAIHLKRKHKLGLDMEAPGEKAPTPGVTADLMIAAGHITLLPVTSGPSWDWEKESIRMSVPEFLKYLLKS